MNRYTVKCLRCPYGCDPTTTRYSTSQLDYWTVFTQHPLFQPNWGRQIVWCASWMPN
ncbi:hypothetical protein HMPREF9621_02579 [Cutibacterium modestum HL037PA2]|nr:hypothetical protein HMPREF9621_02579 [Cutibacterium modestum HL037PA2]